MLIPNGPIPGGCTSPDRWSLSEVSSAIRGCPRSAAPSATMMVRGRRNYVNDHASCPAYCRAALGWVYTSLHVPPVAAPQASSFERHSSRPSACPIRMAGVDVVLKLRLAHPLLCGRPRGYRDCRPQSDALTPVLASSSIGVARDRRVGGAPHGREHMRGSKALRNPSPVL